MLMPKMRFTLHKSYCLYTFNDKVSLCLLILMIDYSVENSVSIY